MCVGFITMDRENAKIKVTMVHVLLSNNASLNHFSTYTWNMHYPLHISVDIIGVKHTTWKYYGNGFRVGFLFFETLV